MDGGIYIPWLDDFAMNSKGKWQRVNRNAYPSYINFNKKWHLESISDALSKCIKNYPKASTTFNLSIEECENIKAVLKMQELLLGITFGDVYIQRIQLVNYSSFTEDEIKDSFLKIL